MVVGLILYVAGNILILAQNWVGKVPSSRAKLEASKFKSLLFNLLIGALIAGTILVIIGLVLVFKVHWWLALLLLIIGEPFVGKRMLD